jgi:hypothetical protein
MTCSEPILVQVIGRYLRGRPGEQWQDLIYRETVDTGPHPKAAILKVIRPVYLALPLAVKRCFLTFAAFREGKRIHEETLLDLWAGWELVAGPHAYIAAESFLRKLEDACLIHREQVDPPHEYDHGPPDQVKVGTYFYMHAMVRGVATGLASEQQRVVGMWTTPQPFCVMEVCSL